MDRVQVAAHAWGAAAFHALVGSHDLVEAASGWFEIVLGVMQ